MVIMRAKQQSKKTGPGERKLLGVKIRLSLIQQLKEYAESVDRPINYCAEKLMEYGLSHQYEYHQRRSANQPSQDLDKGWDAFLTMGATAVRGKRTDTSIRHDSYLYGPGKTK
jgi:hypothetical protein